MENTDKLYLISFGDSAQFRVPFADSREALEKSQKIVGLEKQLNQFLAEKFPAGDFTYYITPKIIEISEADAPEYADYPLLDESAIEKIKQTLLTGIKDMNSLRQLNSDAPFADAPV